MIRYFNYLLSIILFAIFLIFNINSKISTNLQSILPQSENKELLSQFLTLKENKKLFVLIKGSNKKALNNLKEYEKNLLKIDGIKKETKKFNKELANYKEDYYLYLNQLNKNKLKNLNEQDELSKLYKKILNSFIVVPLNRQDPLSLFEKNISDIHIKNGKIFLKDYGYLSIFKIDKNINTLNEYEIIYDKIQALKKENITTFSSIYYFVENSRYIKQDANKIIIIATLILLFLYLFILRNIKLLANTLFTLASSALLATIFITSLYEEISIFVLVFGLSISTISIDYMFHNYFHKNYGNNNRFNKEVFWGFFTTFFAFFILSFIDFLLIKQITQFAMISIFSSYIIFTFIYPKIGFLQKELKFFPLNLQRVKYNYFFIFSILAILYSSLNLNFDFNIKSLDYDNKKLKKQEEFLKTNLLNKELTTIVIKAKTIDELIMYNEQIKLLDKNSTSSLDQLISKTNFFKKNEEFSKLQFSKIQANIDNNTVKVGFKKETFKNIYTHKTKPPVYTYKKLKDFAIAIKKYKDGYLSFVLISKDKTQEVLKENFAYSINLKNLFEKSLKKDFNKMLSLGILSLVFIIFILLLITKRKIFQALTFLTLPSAFIFLYLSIIPINILHIFMLFIILAISIDYAIYSSKDNSLQTKESIIFSALSSFTGFGVLVFSNTASLFSIGSVATLGILAILILILFQKVNNETSSF